jgi:site-specific DNA-methyltransferase (adenine-specific)
MRAFLNTTTDHFLRQEYHELRQEYHFLRQEYHELRQEYHELRRPFFAHQSQEWGEIWRFPLAKNPVHPTQKPVEMLCHMLHVSTRPGALICDPFFGSGTSAVACAMSGRKFVGCEINPHYFDMACRRINAVYEQPNLFLPRTASAKAPIQPALFPPHKEVPHG